MQQILRKDSEQFQRLVAGHSNIVNYLILSFIQLNCYQPFYGLQRYHTHPVYPNFMLGFIDIECVKCDKCHVCGTSYEVPIQWAYW
jgi:hypothetical protein